jgi:hypothetical protein
VASVVVLMEETPRRPRLHQIPVVVVVALVEAIDPVMVDLVSSSYGTGFRLSLLIYGIDKRPSFFRGCGDWGGFEGQTWVQFAQGKTLVGLDSGDTAFDGITPTVYIGEKEHTLTNADGAVTKITEGSTDVITFGY